MNNKTILSLAALGAAALYFLKGKKQAIENIQIKPLDIAINKQKTNFQQLVFNFKIKAANPGNFAVKINEIDLDVLINGKKVSEFQKTNLTTILPGDAQTINLEIVVSNLTVVDVVLNAIADKKPIKLALSGFVNTDLGSAIIDVKKTINV